jgi:hypothetical protein
MLTMTIATVAFTSDLGLFAKTWYCGTMCGSPIPVDVGVSAHI